MAFYYFDASALVKYYVTEPGSTWVRRLIEERETTTGQPLHLIFVAEITRVEMSFLAGGHGAFREHDAYDNGDHFQEHGALRLVPSGFPFQEDSILEKIIAYLA
jgi:hypothetical protein